MTADLVRGLAGVICLCGLAGCSTQRALPQVGDGRVKMPQTMTLTEADQGVARPAVVGEDVLLRLEETPSTGYQWALEASPVGGVEVVDSRWIAPASGGGIGGAGVREMHLKVKTAGEIQLRLKLWREWQGDGSIIRRNEFRLQVTT